MSQASNSVYFPTEKTPSDEVHLLVEEQPEADEQIPRKKKCSFFRIIRKVTLFSLSAYAIYFLYGAAYHYLPSYNETGEYVSDLASLRGKACNPTIPYKVNQTFEFNPQELSSFGLYIFGNSKFSTVRFERYDGNKITLEPEIYLSSIPVADRIVVDSRVRDGSYGFGIKGPSWFQGRDKCIKADITVKVPKNLNSLDKLWVRLPSGCIGTEALANLSFQKLHLELGSGDISLKNVAANQIELTSGIGKIELSETVSETVGLYTRRGDITAKQVRASHLKAGTAEGNINISVKDSVLAYAKSFNGDSSIRIQSFGSETHSLRKGYHYSAGTVNGKSSLFLPVSYKGRFNSATFNGEAKVISNGGEMHLTKNFNKIKKGYRGGDPESSSFAEAACLNGSPILEFF